MEPKSNEKPIVELEYPILPLYPTEIPEDEPRCKKCGEYKEHMTLMDDDGNLSGIRACGTCSSDDDEDE